LAAPASPANTLLVIESHRRHIRQHDSLQVANIDTNFHGGCHTEQIDRINKGDRGTSPMCTSPDNNVSEASLPVGLIVGLSC
jgi:hypothetical protein